MDGQVISNYGYANAGEEEMDIRKGPWTAEEDTVLSDYISMHGEGHWNSLARSAGLKRTGKSCRLRWLNYLRPDVRRGNITLQEQLLILELHSFWGNSWSKIARYLPGRTDNEIKNYWRTRVQKQAKQLKCDVNSKQFRNAMRHVWIPRIVEQIRASESNTDQPTTCSGCITIDGQTYCNYNIPASQAVSDRVDPSCIPELSGSSSYSWDTQVSPIMMDAGPNDSKNKRTLSSGHYSDGRVNGSGLYPEYYEGCWSWEVDLQAGTEQLNDNIISLSLLGDGGGDLSSESLLYWNEENY